MQFPSPLGDYVFNPQQELGERVGKSQFPSPLGDYVFNPCLLKPAPCLIPH